MPVRGLLQALSLQYAYTNVVIFVLSFTAKKTLSEDSIRILGRHIGTCDA